MSGPFAIDDDNDDADYQLARFLQQEEFDSQQHQSVSNAATLPPANSRTSHSNRKRNAVADIDIDTDDPLNATQNLVHPDWETRDPTPDVQALFRAFDAKFFQNRLRCVTLEWSRRMYQCAGICYYRRNRMGTSITIRLSEPLLKLRQRKDLVETMLHEMIHAYLFVLDIREPNGGHGPNFKRIMVSINQTTGTNITVYHTFHDEVNVYKSHVWKCNGLCQHRPPFYGVVKRTCNRAPGPNDLWWAQHRSTCGGYFNKISEPEKKVKAARAAKVSVRGLDDANNVRQRIDDPMWGLATSTSRKTPVMPPPPTTVAAKAASTTAVVRTVTGTKNETAPRSNYGNVVVLKDLTGDNNVTNFRGNAASVVGGNLRNVVGFGDLNSGGGNSTENARRPSVLMSGRGNTLGGGSSSISSSSSNARQNDPPVVDLVRNVWGSKFADEKKSAGAAVTKKPAYNAIPSSSEWHNVGDDDDVIVNAVQQEVIELHSDDDENVDGYVVENVDDNKDHIMMLANSPPRPTQRQLTQPVLSPAERQRAIKREIFHDARVGNDDDDDDEDDDDDDIILIDDEYDDALVEATDSATSSASTSRNGENPLDTSVIDDIFGTDTLLSEYATVNDAMPDQPSDEQIITCPICIERMQRCQLPEHLNGCQGIKREVHARTPSLGHLLTPRNSSPAKRQKRVPRTSTVPTPSARVTTAEAIEPTPAHVETADCPSCWRKIPLAEINQHLDECLS